MLLSGASLRDLNGEIICMPNYHKILWPLVFLYLQSSLLSAAARWNFPSDEYADHLYEEVAPEGTELNSQETPTETIQRELPPAYEDDYAIIECASCGSKKTIAHVIFCKNCQGPMCRDCLSTQDACACGFQLKIDVILDPYSLLFSLLPPAATASACSSQGGIEIKCAHLHLGLKKCRGKGIWDRKKGEIFVFCPLNEKHRTCTNCEKVYEGRKHKCNLLHELTNY